MQAVVKAARVLPQDADGRRRPPGPPVMIRERQVMLITTITVTISHARAHVIALGRRVLAAAAQPVPAGCRVANALLGESCRCVTASSFCRVAVAAAVEEEVAEVAQAAEPAQVLEVVQRRLL